MGFEIVNLGDATIIVTSQSSGRQPYSQAVPPGCLSICMGPGTYRIMENDKLLLAVVCNLVGFRVIPYVCPYLFLIVQTCNCYYFLPGPILEWENWFLQFYDYFAPTLSSKHVGFKIMNGGNDRVVITDGKNGQEDRQEHVDPGSASGCIRAGKYRITNSSGLFHLVVSNSSGYSTHPELPPSLVVQHCNCNIGSPSTAQGWETDFLQLLDFLVTKFPFRPVLEVDITFEIVNQNDVEVLIASRSMARIKHFERVGPGCTSGSIAAGEYAIMSTELVVHSLVFCNSAGVRTIPMRCPNLFQVQSIDIRPRDDDIRPSVSDWDVWFLTFLDFFFADLDCTPAGMDNLPMTHYEIVNTSQADIIVEGKITDERSHCETLVPGHTSSCLKEGAFDVRNPDGTHLFTLICKSWGCVTHPDPPPVVVQRSCCGVSCSPRVPDWEHWLTHFLSFLP